MKHIIQNECKRALFGRGMAVSLVISFSVIAWHLYDRVFGPEAVSSVNIFTRETLFQIWIGGNVTYMQTYLYFKIIPLLCVLPAGATLFEDYKGGYTNFLFVRTARLKFLAAKYIAVFLSGGFAVTVPLAVNFLCTALRFPALKPEPIMMAGPNLNAMWLDLYYGNPWLFTMLSLFIIFLLSGAVATLALLFTYLTDYKFLVLLLPFVCCSILEVIENISNIPIALSSFLIPAFPERYGFMLWIYFLFFAAVGIVYYIMGCFKE